MTRQDFEHGLIVGKFYPPHMGHEYLIRTALLQCRSVTVLVLASSRESIPMQARAAWLRACFPSAANLRVVAELDDVAVDYQSDTIWQAHVDVMQRALRRAREESTESIAAVDVVYSSEAYGAELGRRFGAAHVCLDQTRALYPISGTQARADAVGCWRMLPASVRAGLSLRVVVLGAESSGTTTLACDLQAALCKREGVWQRTERVPEYGREYNSNLLAAARARNAATTRFEIEWQESDFIHISNEQTRREQLAAEASSPVLVCDTDAFATCVWHERYLGCASDTLARIARALPPRALYLLTDHRRVPFEDDGLRDGEHLRPWMTARFAEALAAQAVPWSLVSGAPQERLATALALLDQIATRHFTFAAP